ncbi:hypothetical protein ABNavy4_032 [Acinetobacter phage AB-Navy4]|nr:hypothetical protein ABNavy4_032 [Acinetobacter phage AB-Navy4]
MAAYIPIHGYLCIFVCYCSNTFDCNSYNSIKGVLIGPLPEALPLTFYVIFVIVVWFGLLCVDENSEL